MISSAAVLMAVAATSVVLVSAAPEHAKRYRNNANDISSRSGKMTAFDDRHSIKCYTYVVKSLKKSMACFPYQGTAIC